MMVISDRFGPGMVSRRRCSECGALLGRNDSARCVECVPQLSALAREVGERRRAASEALVVFERELGQLENLIRKLEKAVRHADERYGRH